MLPLTSPEPCSKGPGELNGQTAKTKTAMLVSTRPHHKPDVAGDSMYMPGQ